MRSRLAYRKWRALVFERDNYTCTDCGLSVDKNKSKQLNAHHIISMEEDLGLALSVNNGKTLCKNCHKKLHAKTSKRKDPKVLGKTFTPSKIEKIKAAWLIHRNASTVSKLMSISKATVNKYRKTGGWDKLAEKISKEADKKLVKKLGKQMADNLSIVGEVKAMVLKALRRFHDNDELIPSVNDLDKIIRLEEFVQGNPDSRPDSSVTLNQVVHNITNQSDKELLELIKSGEHKYKTLGKEAGKPVNRLRKTGIVSPNDT